MDLALHLGMTKAGLSRAMSEREFVQWQRYAGRKMLPERKTHLLLAQIALLISVTMGGAKNAKLEDFLLDPSEEPDDGAIGMRDITDTFGDVEVLE